MRPLKGYQTAALLMSLSSVVYLSQAPALELFIQDGILAEQFAKSIVVAKDMIQTQEDRPVEHSLIPPAKSIRKWGCNCTQTPFVFVHIGKAGGGNIRRYLALSATNYTRSPKEWGNSAKDHSFYPVQRINQTVVRAQLCNSGHPNFMPRQRKSFEGTHVCTATTPIGQALACPKGFGSRRSQCRRGDSTRHNPLPEHTVYVGHNVFGNEIHWLPVPYLQKWWDEKWGPALCGGNYSNSSNNNDNNSNKNDTISLLIKTLGGTPESWCGAEKTKSLGRRIRSAKMIEECGKHLKDGFDEAARQAILRQTGHDATPQLRGRAWSAVYSSLPVLRTTVLREPFAWLASKFAWGHMYEKLHLTCDNVTQATSARGWARSTILSYITMLCGSDCQTRQEATLEEKTAQAEANLRHGFAVVAILEQDDRIFYEMIQKRVDYMRPPQRKLPSGGRHGSDSKGENGRCKDRFKTDQAFRREMVQSSPEIAAAVHLYKVGLEVHESQKQELAECSGSGFDFESTGGAK